MICISVRALGIASLLFLLPVGPAEAQWSIGAPGERTAKLGQRRFANLVFANPLPGREAEFNDWYLNTHLGDLVQLDGWLGAQRFRLVPGQRSPASPAVHRFGYLVVWDQEGASTAALRKPASDAIAGGKSRRGAAFDYAPGASRNVWYEAAAARRTRPDGQGPTVPARSDVSTPRLGRFMMMEFADPPAGVSEAAFEKDLDRRVEQVLAVRGWLAAQRFRFAPAPGRDGQPATPADLPRHLIVWELEGRTAADPQAALTVTGLARPSAADAATLQTSYWEPISPYVTKDDFQR